jgi:hypothetical protein
MGKKSKRKNKNNGGPPRNDLAAAVVPTAAVAPAPTIYDTISRLMEARNFDEVLKVESKYRHLDTFSNVPEDEINILYAFGCAHEIQYEEQGCSNRAIHYFERIKDCIIQRILSQKSECLLPFCIQIVVIWKKQCLRIDGHLQIALACFDTHNLHYHVMISIQFFSQARYYL